MEKSGSAPLGMYENFKYFMLGLNISCLFFLKKEVMQAHKYNR